MMLVPPHDQETHRASRRRWIEWGLVLLLGFLVPGREAMGYPSSASPSLVAQLPLQAGGVVFDFSSRGDLAAVCEGALGFELLRWQQGGQPASIAWVDTPGECLQASWMGERLLVADGSAGLHVYEIGAENHPTRIATYSPADGASKVVGLTNAAIVVTGGGAIEILSLSNPAAPQRLQRLTSPNGFSGVSVDGTTLYAMSPVQTPVQVYSITNLSAARFLANLPAQLARVSGRSGLLYATTWAGDVEIHDAAKPAAPKLLGSYTAAPPYASSIEVAGTTTVVGGAACLLLDVANPAQPRRIGYSFDFSPWGWKGNWVGSPSAGVLRVFDATTSSGFERISQLPTLDGRLARDLKVRGSTAYLATDGSVELIDFSEPAHPRRLGSFPEPAAAVWPIGSRVYTQVGEVLTLLDPSNLPSIRKVRSYTNAPVMLRELGGRLLMAGGEHALAVFDLGTPDDPALVGSLDLPDPVISADFGEPLGVVSEGTTGFAVIDYSDVAHPVRRGHVELPTYGGIRSLRLVGSRLRVTASDGRPHDFDLSNPDSPRSLGTVQGTPLMGGVSPAVDGYWYEAVPNGIAVHGPGLFPESAVIDVNNTVDTAGVVATEWGTAGEEATLAQGPVLSWAGASVTFYTPFRPRVGPPLPVLQPVDTSSFPGQPATVAAVASGESPLAYQWYFQSIAIPGATEPVLTLPKLAPAQEGAYFAIITNRLGSITSATAQVMMSRLPRVRGQSGDVAIVPGDPLTLGVDLEWTGPLSLQWYANGSPVAKTNPLILPSFKATQAGAYSLVMKTAYGSLTSAVMNVSAILYPVITTEPQDRLIPQGRTGWLLVEGKNFTGSGIQWYFNDTPIPGATSAELDFTNFDPSQAGLYRAVVSNSSGSTTSRVAVVSLAIPPAFLSLPVPTTIPWGESRDFSFRLAGTPPFLILLSNEWQGVEEAFSATGPEVRFSITNSSYTGLQNYRLYASNLTEVVAVSPSILQIERTAPDNLILYPGSHEYVYNSASPYPYSDLKLPFRVDCLGGLRATGIVMRLALDPGLEFRTVESLTPGFQTLVTNGLLSVALPPIPAHGTLSGVLHLVGTQGGMSDHSLWLESPKRLYSPANALITFTVQDLPFAMVTGGPATPVAGRPMGDWIAEWWRWGLSLPAGSSPLLGHQGTQPAAGDGGPVWFLPGNIGPGVQQSPLQVRVPEVLVPEDRYLLFPLVASLTSLASEGPGIASSNRLRPLLRPAASPLLPSQLLFGVQVPQAPWAGLPVEMWDGLKRRVEGLEIHLPPENLLSSLDPGFSSIPAITEGVGDGYWVMLKPSDNDYEIIHSANLPDGSSTSFDYAIRRTPSPPAITLSRNPTGFQVEFFGKPGRVYTLLSGTSPEGPFEPALAPIWGEGRAQIAFIELEATGARFFRLGVYR